MKEYLSSSIGKKQILAVTGLLLCGFLVAHLAGNLLLLKSDGQSFNDYAHALRSNPLLIPAELGLAGLFLTHILLGLHLHFSNKAANPIAYAVDSRKGELTFASKTMPYTGGLVLAFLIYHLITIRMTWDPAVESSLYKFVYQHFKNPLNVILYLAAFLALAIHLSHGFQSMFQSFGFRHEKWTPQIRKVGLFFAWGIVFFGYSIIPLYIFFVGEVK